jgi:predicted nucleic acid-binding protein
MSIDKIYWDSDAFLGWFQNEPIKVELCSGTLKRAEEGEVVIFTSALTIAEVLWLRGAPKVPKEKSDLVRKFFRRSYFRIRNVTRRIAEDAQDLVWMEGIRPKDAIHVATAMDVAAIALETFDENLITNTGRIGSPPLEIRKPIASAQGTLL